METQNAIQFGEVVGRKNVEALKMIMETTPPPARQPLAPPLLSLGYSAPAGMTVGPLLMKWLPLVEDPTFGISYDKNKNRYVMGKCKVEFDSEDNFHFLNASSGEKRTFQGTNGLWELVTRIKPIDYTSSDLEAYNEILEFTEALYQSNDKTTKKTKPSRSEKYNLIIKKLWDQKTGRGLELFSGDARGKYLENDDFVPSGFLVYKDTPVEVKVFTSYEDIQKRLIFIASEEKVGNNNFHNEKAAIVSFIKHALDNIVSGDDATRGKSSNVSFKNCKRIT